jgi:copper transport protein
MSTPLAHRVRAGASRATIVAAIAVFLVAVWATPASAHAQLEYTQPAESSVLKVSPSEVVLHFGEDVEIDFGSIRVFNSSGSRVDSGGAHHPGTDGHAVAIDLPPHLPDGAYVVAWRVISADSHPVHGAFIFSVGTSRGLTKASVLATALANASGSTVVGALFWLIRFAAFAGLLALVGLVAIVLCVTPGSGRNRRIRRSAWVAWAVLTIATLLGIVIQGVYAAALPLTDITRTALVREVLATRFGRVEELRLVLLALAAPLLFLVTSSAPARGTRRGALVVACGLVGAGMLATPGLAGHATTGSAIVEGFIVDLAHLGAASLWLGGLTVLACLLIPSAPGTPAEPVGPIARSISTIAAISVLVVVVSGTLQAFRQIGSVSELLDTDYGRLLLIKVSVVVVLICLGALSRRLLRRGDVDAPASGRSPGRLTLRRSVGIELAVAAGVLAVTALLVNAPPAREDVNLPFTSSYTALRDQVNVIVSPAAAGVRNVLHIYILGPTGQPRAVPEVDASLTLPSDSIGPLSLPLSLVTIGHYRDSDVTFFASGNWILTITLRTTAIDEQVVPLPLPVR